jgi:cytochrome b561
MLKDSPSRYGVISRLLHWLTALLILAQLTRFIGSHLDKTHWINTTIKPLHGSFGVLLFVIIVVRIVWMISQYKHRPTPHKFTKLAKSAHHLLYLLTVVLPLTGIAYIAGKGYGIKVFGKEIIPGGEPSPLLSAFGGYHGAIAWLLLLVVAGHLAAALYHHFVARDDTLKRML